MAVAIKSAGGIDLEIDTNSNAARAVLYDSAGNPIVQAPNSVYTTGQKIMPAGGLVEGNWIEQRMDRLGNLRPGNDLLLLRDPIEGATINTNIWTASVTTFTQAQLATTGINFNNGNGLAANSYSILTSNKQFPVFPQVPLRCRHKARIVPQTNAIAELGFGSATGTTGQITNGAFWRWTSAGALVPVLSYNSGDVTGTDVSSLLNPANYYTYEVVISDHQITYSIYLSSLLINQQTINVLSTQPNTFSVTHVPVFARLYIIGTAAPAAPYIYISNVQVQAFDALTHKPWSHQLAGTGLGGEVNPATFAQITTWANSAAPANATLSNTAAGYSTIGGLFSFVAVGGANTDYALFGMAIPAPYTFYLTGVHIASFNTGAAVATTPTILMWGVYVNSPGVSLASAAPLMRVPLGAQSFAVGDPIGKVATDIDINFDTPLRTDSGKFVGFILRMPVATATGSQVIQGSITPKGYFE